MNEKQFTGLIIKDGVLHLYEDPEDLRNDLIAWGKDWSRVAWIDKTIVHAKEMCSTECKCGGK